MFSSLSRTFWSQCYAEDEDAYAQAYEEADKVRCLSMEEQAAEDDDKGEKEETEKEEESKAHPVFDFLPTVITYTGPLAAKLHEQLVREQLDYNRKLLALKMDQ
ncbi:hypothetical protein BASA81_004747 [Batrachochytrium salamandrivorans]|nr:hypothetical protein BASA81_004747 [Batrachochytrium salamandrivorans]